MTTVAGLFANSSDATSAADELAAAGWPHDQISVVAAAQETAEVEHPHLAAKDAEKGAIVGGLAGLFLGLTEMAVPGVGLLLVGGWLAATLLGAGVGAATGGLVGALVEAGISHDVAGHLAEGVKRGEILVTVRTDDARAAQVGGILRQHHAIRIEDQIS